MQDREGSLGDLQRSLQKSAQEQQRNVSDMGVQYLCRYSNAFWFGKRMLIMPKMTLGHAKVWFRGVLS